MVGFINEESSVAWSRELQRLVVVAGTVLEIAELGQRQAHTMIPLTSHESTIIIVYIFRKTYQYVRIVPCYLFAFS
jgi:hypothetical protein